MSKNPNKSSFEAELFGKESDHHLFPTTSHTNTTKVNEEEQWVRKKSAFLHKTEEKDIKKEPYRKERNLLEEDTEDEDTDTGYMPPPNRVTDETPADPFRELSKSELLAKVFRPLAAFLAYAGFFPYYVVEDEDSYFQVVYKKKSLRTMIFFGCFFTYLVLYVMSCIGFVWIYNEWPVMAGTEPYIIPAVDLFQVEVNLRWETVMISNCWVMLLVAGFWMTMAVVGSYHTFHYAEDYGHFHSYWHKTLTLLDIDPTDYIRQFLKKELIMFCVLMFFLILSWYITASFRICCSLVGCFVFGPFLNNLPESSAFIVIQLLGFLIVAYGYCGLRATLLQFVFYCRLITNTAKIWNYRFESVLVGALFRDTLTPKMFAQYRILLKDHFLVVQLYKLTEGCFGGVLQAYYLLQTTCLTMLSLYLYFNLSARKVNIFTYKNYTFEKYDFYMPAFIEEEIITTNEEENDIQTFQKSLHSMFYAFLLFQSLSLCYHVTNWGQIAVDEGMDGFNVLRKHGLIMCTNRSERNLIHSLTISFARNNPLAVTADGYFTVDKQLFCAIIAVIVNYVTMCIQYIFEEYIVASVDFRLDLGAPSIGDRVLLKSLPE